MHFCEKSDIHQKELNIHQQNEEYFRKLCEIANIHQNDSSSLLHIMKI